jgi:hypothetical protein
MPALLPGATTHEVPGQQSAVVVHGPQPETHCVPWQTSGEPPSAALRLGTQGRPLQQLALEAHAWPAPTHVAGAHRGTPTLSWWQVSCVSQLPAQQSHDELHDIV